MTDEQPYVTMRFVSGKDDVKIAESIALHLKKPVVITRPDGTKNYVIPAETGVFDTRDPSDLHERHQVQEMATSQPGPPDHPDDLHVMLYDAPGG